jgi:hypothetical protein
MVPVPNKLGIFSVILVTFLHFNNFITTVIAQSPLNQFLPPVTGVYAGNADLINVTYTQTIEDCAQLCLTYTGPSYSNLGWYVF